MFECVSELVLPEPCFGWILCFKKEEFGARDTSFIGEKEEKNRPVVLRPKNERTDVEKRGEKRD